MLCTLYFVVLAQDLASRWNTKTITRQQQYQFTHKLLQSSSWVTFVFPQKRCSFFLIMECNISNVLHLVCIAFNMSVAVQDGNGGIGCKMREEFPSVLATGCWGKCIFPDYEPVLLTKIYKHRVSGSIKKRHSGRLALADTDTECYPSNIM